MLNFVYGLDGYRVKTRSNQIKQNWLDEHPASFSLFNFNFESQNHKEILDKLGSALKTASLLDDAKLIIISNLFSEKTLPNQVLKIIQESNCHTSLDSTIVIAQEGDTKELTKKDKEAFLFFSGKHSKVEIIEPLSGIKLEKWIQELALKNNLTINSPEIKKVIQLTNSDTWQIAQEITKLANYCQGKSVTFKDINELILPKVNLNIFDLTDALSAKNKAKAIECVFKEIKNGKELYPLFAMIIFQFRNLLLIKDGVTRKMNQAEIAKKAGLHPFVVLKTIRSLDRFTIDELKSKYQQLLDLDTKSKMGTINLTDSIYTFLIS